MSVEKRFVLICDECGREEDFVAEDGVRSRVAARKAARDQSVGKWRTGLKSTPERPSMYDTKVDICSWCTE